MTLPASSVRSRTETVDLPGGSVTVHGLTLIQTRACRDATPDEADVLCVAWGADITPAEAREWLVEADPEDARAVIGAVMRLSGLLADAQFPREQSNGAGAT